MSKVDLIYNSLLEEIIIDGVQQQDRTGTGTLSIFGKMLKFDMSDGFPLLTTKHVWYKGVLHELLWFLSGSMSIKYLVDNGVNIWNAWPYKRYKIYREYLLQLLGTTNKKLIAFPKVESKYYSLPLEGLLAMDDIYLLQFLKDTPDYNEEEFISRIKEDYIFEQKWGQLGPVYGKQWTSWAHETYPPIVGYSGYSGHSRTLTAINQIENVQHLLRTDPDSRRMLVNALNVADLPYMALDPCHYSFQFFSEKTSTGRKLSLLWNQRSVDVFLGLPFNIASYATLLHMMAHVTNHEPGTLIASLGNTHLYSNHLQYVHEQLSRRPFDTVPTINIKDNRRISDIFRIQYDDIEIINYEKGQYHPAIKAPIAV